MENFTNDDILISNLPKFEESNLIKIQPEYWKVMLINNIFRVVFLGLIIAFFSFKMYETRPYIWQISIAFPALVIVYFILLKKAFNFRSYSLREHDILYKYGIVSRKTTIIPFIRIQHIGINEGFIARYFKLAQLQIFTAGSDSNDLKISGLLKEDAEKIKELVLGSIKNKVDGKIIEE